VQHAVSYAQILGHVIRGHRELRGIALEAMATEMGFQTRSGWSRVESGDTTITAPLLRKAARHLGLRPWSVVRDADNLAEQLTKSGVTVLDDKPKDKTPWVIGGAAILAVVAGAAGAVVATKKPQNDE
jgi:transcriptional regulator with XRE-family HTH domain